MTQATGRGRRSGVRGPRQRVADVGRVVELAGHVLQRVGLAGLDAVEVAAAPVVATPPAFAQCRSCHTVDKGGKNGIGPNLWGVFGKSAGQHAGFNYSPALKSSGRTWDRETLDAFLSSPMKTIPGTRMAFPGISNDAKRGEVIDFLETLAD